MDCRIVDKTLRTYKSNNKQIEGGKFEWKSKHAKSLALGEDFGRKIILKHPTHEAE